jgi:hypothetical protein
LDFWFENKPSGNPAGWMGRVIRPIFLHPSDFYNIEKIGWTDKNFPIFPSDFFHSIGQKIGRMQKMDPFFVRSCEPGSNNFLFFVVAKPSQNQLFRGRNSVLGQMWHFILCQEQNSGLLLNHCFVLVA